MVFAQSVVPEPFSIGGTEYTYLVDKHRGFSCYFSTQELSAHPRSNSKVPQHSLVAGGSPAPFHIVQDLQPDVSIRLVARSPLPKLSEIPLRYSTEAVCFRVIHAMLIITHEGNANASLPGVCLLNF
ncbi:hypothetical protein K470DRAFT_175859 [Piedraia hortae CBS 480.64]|uniref:Uncharacterized protein n=1 Tax=Piedraia hortae CBS 480.64 TaxID=1314780 RepID=A0A6A7C517_9PEZI|nr:hypothetical protein K470DRAFT_175859 [Piedraia hortae CBS 480.64]